MQKINVNYSVTSLSVVLLLTTLFSSCNSDSIKISGRFIGGDSSVAYLEEISSSHGGAIVDSVELNTSGEFIFNFKAKDGHHRLYNVVYDWSTIPIFATAGEHIKLNSVGNVAKNYTVEGSEESELIRRFYQNYINGIAELDKIAMEYAKEDISEEKRKELTLEYSNEYNRIKREQLEFIITNKSSLAAVYALYQRLPNDSYLFTGKNDVIYYRTVAEALEENYPDSPYRKSIQKDIDEFDAINRIQENMVTRGYPDLELNDMYGKAQKLSDKEGKVILLDFWSAQIGSSNRNNAELKEIYAKYKDQGFDIYQVAIDNTKSTWINAIQEQSLPWTSVSDLKGNRSQSLSLYNITALPSNFLINKEGDVIARDIYGDKLLEAIREEIAK
ncbi:MAG: TlpA disulfide reductase family protein [Rikenellaceae bacterium]